MSHPLMTPRPIAWTIAGSDSGGGAGIQADLKTMNALGVHGCSVVTALTAQNTRHISRIEHTSPRMLQAQLEALSADLPPVAVKLGMLGKAESVRAIGRVLRSIKPFVVCDPVMLSGNGQSLTDDKAVQALISELLPWTDLLTPNRTEAECLTGRTIRTMEDVEAAARDLHNMGARAVLIKGGHAPENTEFPGLSQDFWSAGRSYAWFSSPRRQTAHTHGTGCTLSAAITACIALGMDLADACVIAKAYVNQGIRLSPGLGGGNGPLTHLGWPEQFEDMPWLTGDAWSGAHRPHFLDCGPEPIGFYPIVNRFAWVEKLLSLGVTTIQLRIKDMSGEALEREIARSSVHARQSNARLFINDYWGLALKYHAYGVHLGQSDLNALQPGDLSAMEQAGMRLGVSTHCYAEVARALSLRPSYIAIGPIFPTTTKTMRFAPQGLAALRRWRKTLPCPLVAIGGVFLDNAPEVLAQGADGIAVVRDIVNASDVAARTAEWLQLFESRRTISRETGEMPSEKAHQTVEAHV